MVERHITMNRKECEYLDIWRIINSPEQKSDRGGITITYLLVHWMKGTNFKKSYIGKKNQGTLDMKVFIHEEIL